MAATLRYYDQSIDWTCPIHQAMYHKGRNKSGMQHKSVGKLHIGPAGIGCPCCTKLSPNKLKIYTRRFERRKSKQILMLEESL